MSKVFETLILKKRHSKRDVLSCFFVCDVCGCVVAVVLSTKSKIFRMTSRDSRKERRWHNSVPRNIYKSRIVLLRRK